MHRPKRSSNTAVFCETIFLMMEPPVIESSPGRNRNQRSASSSVDPIHVRSGHVRTLKPRLNRANPKDDVLSIMSLAVVHSSELDRDRGYHAHSSCAPRLLGCRTYRHPRALPCQHASRTRTASTPPRGSKTITFLFLIADPSPSSYPFNSPNTNHPARPGKRLRTASCTMHARV